MNRRPNRNLSVEEAVAVVTFAETGLSQRYIGHRLGVNQSTVSRVLRRHRETQEYSRRPEQGRKRATTAVQDRFLMTLRERFITVPRLQKIQCNIVPTLMFGGGSVVMWDGITLEVRTKLVGILRGSNTVVSYIVNILEPHVMPFAPFRGNYFLFMHDTAKPHSARIVQEYLVSCRSGYHHNAMASQKSRS
jgi:predicted transcriptional regulator